MKEVGETFRGDLLGVCKKSGEAELLGSEGEGGELFGGGVDGEEEAIGACGMIGIDEDGGGLAV